MRGKQNIYLIGSMGSGKTAVGRQLGRLLHVPFYDSDAEVVRRAGVDIPYIFEQEGEAGFRQRERDAIQAITQLEPIILATGGGAILMPENRQRLTESGKVIYLETSLSQQLQRVGNGRGRPLLREGNLSDRLQQLRLDREPFYLGMADYVVSTDHRRVSKVAEHILREVRGHEGPIPQLDEA